MCSTDIFKKALSSTAFSANVSWSSRTHAACNTFAVASKLSQSVKPESIQQILIDGLAMPVQIADVVVPVEFTNYIVENSLVSTALFQSVVAVHNGIMESQLQAGADSFTVHVWGDIQDNEANISTDNPAIVSTPPSVITFLAANTSHFSDASHTEIFLRCSTGYNSAKLIKSRQLVWQATIPERLCAHGNTSESIGSIQLFG